MKPSDLTELISAWHSQWNMKCSASHSLLSSLAAQAEYLAETGSVHQYSTVQMYSTDVQSNGTYAMKIVTY